MTNPVIETGTVNCPNCAMAMNRHRFLSTDVRPLEIDICHSCHAIWFDAHESARLSPEGVVDVFRFIHAHGGASTAQLSAKVKCARCRSPMEPASDIARNNKFFYYRCPQGHGRLTTFLHFLREKQFVRDLTFGERQALAAHVRQIKCSSCSAPIDIGEHAACTYCGAAVSVLDKDATQKALDHYLKERQAQQQPTPAMLPAAEPSYVSGNDLNYLMFNIGADIVGAFARMATRPAGAFAATAAGASMAGAAVDSGTLSSLSGALAQSGLGESLSLVDIGPASSAIVNAVSGDLGSGLADSVSTFAESAFGVATEAATEGASSSGLVDLVSDGIGAIVDGMFN